MQYEGLIEENTQLKKALIQSKSYIERKQNELETQMTINEELRQQIEKTRNDIAEIQQKYRVISHEKKQVEQQYDNATRSWKSLIEQKQRELEELQSKLMPTFDQDMIRIKIINEIEVPHRQQLDAKQQEIEKLNEIIYQLKRKIDLETAKVETLQLEHTRETQLMQERQKIDIIDLQHQIDDLTKILEDNKDKETIRRLRKDLDEFKLKFSTCDTENEELRNERDKIREEKNEIMIKFARQLDQERNDKRQFKSDFDKLQVRTRFLEDEFRKEKQRREQLSTDFEVAKSEKDQLLTDLRKKDDSIHYLQRKITDMEEEQLETEQKVQDKLTRLYHEEHDKYLQERNKAVTLQKDLDNLKKRFSDLQDDYKLLKDRYLKDTTDTKDNNKQLNDEIDKLKKTLSQQTKDIGDFERTNKNREEQINDLENENETLKRRNRELQHRIQLIEINPLPSPTSPQIYFQQSQAPTFAQQLQAQEQFETKPKLPQVQQNSSFSENEPQNQAQKQSLQQITEENRQLVAKIKKLNNKLKQANDKILELSMKNTLLEKQLYKQPQTFIENPDRIETTQHAQHVQHAHSQSPFKVEYQQYSQPPIQTDNMLDRKTQDKQRQRNLSGAQLKQDNFQNIHDDELLNKVMRLTDASSQNKYW